MAEESRPAKWVISLGGGDWATVKYGIVEYLRTRPKMRAATAITGLLWVAGWVASMAGFKWHSLLFPSISAVFVTPTLLWLAVVSGPDFKLAFAAPKTTEPPVALSTEIKGVLDTESQGLEALNNSYISTETYARSSFRWAMSSLIAGISIGCANVWLMSSEAAIASRDHSSLFIWIFASTMFLICIIFLIRSMLMFRRAAAIHDRLLDLQKVITAIKYLEKNPEQLIASNSSSVVSKLLSPMPRASDSLQ